MKKRLFLLALIATSMTYADEFFEASGGITLDDTVVSVTGFAESSKNVAAKVTVITSEELEKKNIKTVAEALTTLGNVSLLSQNALGASVDLRGQGTTAKANVRVLLDGIYLNSLDTDHGNVPINNININDIERIEIIPGGGSVVYGTGTAGGVVNIITKKNLVNNGKNISGIISTEIASYNTREYNLSLNGRLNEKIQLGVAYNSSESEGYRDNSAYEKETFDLKAQYQISDKQNLTLKYSYFTSDRETPLALTEVEVKKDRTQGALATGDLRDTAKDEGKRLSLSYSNKISNNARFSLDSGYSNVLSNGTVNNWDEDQIVIKPKFSYDYPKGNFTVGYDYSDQKVLRNTAPFYDIKKASNSVYLYNRYDIKNLQIITGYRKDKTVLDYDALKNNTEDFKKTYNQNAYNLGLNYAYSDSGKLYIKTESGYTMPHPRHLIMSDYKNSSLTTIFSNVKPEEYITFEIGTEDYIGNTLVKGALYITDKENEIRRTRPLIGGTRYTIIENIDATRRMGGELSLNHNFGKLSLSESLNYVDAKVTKGAQKDKYVPMVSKISASINATYEINDNFDISSSIIYKDKYYADSNNLSGLVGDILLTNIKASYNTAKNIKLYGGINNLFDKEYYNSVSYNPATTSKGITTPAYLTYDPAAERNYFVGFSYSF